MRKIMVAIGATALILAIALYAGVGVWNLGAWFVGYLWSGGRVR